MGEQSIKGKWKVRGRKVAKPSSPMIGMVYESTGKFFGKTIRGVLVEMFDQNDEAVLRTKDNKLVSVDKNSLKLVAT